MGNDVPMWLYRRPRLLNVFHSLGLAKPHSQMTAEEMASLKKHATGKKKALEIGTYMGVSASIIASSMDENGILYCVDPFESKNNKPHPGFLMASRELKRSNSFNKVRFLLGFSNDKKIIDQIPTGLDFVFIDGDHSYEGLKNDWSIILPRITKGGIVCLHDTTIPAKDPSRNFGSVDFFNDVIRADNNFELLETIYSMNVLLKK